MKNWYNHTVSVFLTLFYSLTVSESWRTRVSLPSSRGAPWIRKIVIILWLFSMHWRMIDSDTSSITGMDISSRWLWWGRRSTRQIVPSSRRRSRWSIPWRMRKTLMKPKCDLPSSKNRNRLGSNSSEYRNITKLISSISYAVSHNSLILIHRNSPYTIDRMTQEKIASFFATFSDTCYTHPIFLGQKESSNLMQIEPHISVLFCSIHSHNYGYVR